VGAYNEAREEQIRQAWRAYHVGQSERLRRALEKLIQHHEREAAKFAEGA
jgi:hypothetical protein